jgi:hypothetical protein
MKLENVVFLAARKSWRPQLLGPMKLAIVCLGILSFAQVALASPELPITRGPVVATENPYTGPPSDPFTTEGQWFYDPTTEGTFPLPVQFYDNPTNGGGGWAGTTAINGVVNGVTTVGGNITAFSIQAQITYDMPPLSGWPPGANLHGETLTNNQSLNIQVPPTLTANFAISGLGNLPTSFTGPYVQQTPQIIAQNYTLLAWYCWTFATNGQAAGGYYVPAWNNFTLVGGTWEDALDFTVAGTGLTPADPRYGVLMDSFTNNVDIFTSQSSALKISTWESSIYEDPGQLYPTNEEGIIEDLSDVSVFVPEPSIFALLGLGIFGLLGYAVQRRKA